MEGCTPPPPPKKVHAETRLQSSYFNSRAYGKAGNGNGNGNGCGHLPYNVSFSIGQKDIHLVNALE